MVEPLLSIAARAIVPQRKARRSRVPNRSIVPQRKTSAQDFASQGREARQLRCHRTWTETFISSIVRAALFNPPTPVRNRHRSLPYRTRREPNLVPLRKFHRPSPENSSYLDGNHPRTWPADCSYPDGNNFDLTCFTAVRSQFLQDLIFVFQISHTDRCKTTVARLSAIMSQSLHD